MVEFKELGEICEIKGRIGFRGYTREDQVEKGEGAISLSPGNITNSVLNYDTCTYITWDKYEESPEIMVSEGDIILCKTASVGKVARVRQLPEKATINPQLVLIKNIKTNPQYLFYVIDDNPFQSKIKGLAGVGSVPNVSQAKLGAIQIPVPSVSEQNRIVGILDTFTASIENLKQQIAERRKQYEHYRDQLLDLEGKEGVEMKKLGEVCEVYTGGEVPNNTIKGQLSATEEYPYAVYANGKETYGYSNTYQIAEDAVCISSIGANTGAVFYKKGKFTPAIRLKVLIPKDGVITKYLFYASSKIDFRGKNTGSVPNINANYVKNKHILVPPLQEQQRIVSILDTFEASIQNLEAQLKEREKQYEYYRNKLLTFE